jgi:fatty-acyl-CoA synthase
MSTAPAFPEILDPIRWWGELAPQRRALVDRSGGGRRTLSYRDLDQLADGWAHLLRRHGAGPGTRVAVLAPDCVELVALFFGALRTGAALVPLNWRLAPPELQAVLADARPLLALHHPALIPPPGARHAGQWLPLEQPSHAPADAHGDGEPVAADGSRPALILYTSGSTGRPKGVVLPLRQILYNAIATCIGWELGPHDVAPISTPLFHTGGWNVFATPLWHCGGTVVMTDRFDAARFLDLLAEESCTVALAVPTQLVMLLAAPGWGRPLPALRCFFSGGAPCPAPVAEQVRAAGYRLREGYGLTECGPNCFAISDEDAVRLPGVVGRPVPFLRARICDPAGRDVSAGEVGELWLRGPQLFAGYFDDAERTRAAVTTDGWLRTGDLARRDADGFHAICGRLREMFISGGENVFPGEVEAVLASCPGVLEVAVVGVPDAHWGEVGHAFIVAAAGFDADFLTRHARAGLAAYKVPRHVTLLAELPRLGSGKVDRGALQRTLVEDA